MHGRWWPGHWWDASPHRCHSSCCHSRHQGQAPQSLHRRSRSVSWPRPPVPTCLALQLADVPCLLHDDTLNFLSHRCNGCSLRLIECAEACQGGHGLNRKLLDAKALKHSAGVSSLLFLVTSLTFCTACMHRKCIAHGICLPIPLRITPVRMGPVARRLECAVR